MTIRPVPQEPMMPGKSKRAYTSRPLVGGFLERISSAAFSRCPKELTALVGTQHGVYALYKKDHLYYVGLATDLHRRINHHLKDRHAGKWDRFSLYLIHKADHIKELESLLLHIASPDGNRVTGKLRRAEDLRDELKARVKRARDREIDEIFGQGRARRGKCATSAPDAALSAGAKRAWRTRRAKVASSGAGDTPALAPFIKRRLVIRAKHKGKEYRAEVRRSGRIRYEGKLYDSPTTIAQAITGGSVSGWWFWRYRADNGEWLRLQELRRKK